MGQGGLIFCEWDSIRREYPDYQRAFYDLETRCINYATDKWFPKKTPLEAFGGLTPVAGEQLGETSILPALFDPNPLVYGGGAFGGTIVAGFTTPPAYWRQLFSTIGNQTLIQGSGTSETIPEDFIVGWMGLAFPNKEQQITEIRWQTSDRKYARVNIEEMHSYNKPALIFEEGFLLKEEQAFHLYGYVEGTDYQRIVMLGATFYKIIDKVLGNPGAAIT